MKRIIPFVKEVSFETKIKEITAIALEHNLKLENDDSVVGNFVISGKYKENDISINEVNFEKEISFDITLDDKYDASKVKIDIDDFYYEVVDNERLKIHVDVLVDNLVYKESKPALEDVKTDSNKEEMVSLQRQDKKEDDKVAEEEVLSLTNEENEKPVKRNDITSDVYDTFKLDGDNYVTYKVHIIRQNETIKDIEEKYNVSASELEKYNTLDNIMLGSKIIVPLKDEQTN